MLKFLGKRTGYGLLVMLGVITVVFFLFTILPGDPARMMLGQRADISSVEAIRTELGLDRPVHIRFLNYVNDLSPVSLHKTDNEQSFFYLDESKYNYTKILSVGGMGLVVKVPYMGRSYQSNRTVTEVLAVAFPNTLLLAFVSISFAMLLGVLLGIFSAIRNNSFISKFILVFSVSGMSLPSFFAAIIIAWLFAFVLADYTGLNMTGSLMAVDDYGRGEYIQWKNLILPALTLGIRPLAIVAELTRSSLINVLSQDYIRTAKAKGLSFYRVITRHALKNAMNPVITAISGWFASLMAGAVFVEYVFDWKGIGVVIVESLETYDFPLIMGAVLLISVMLVIINILVDISYGLLDPRIRLQ
ncbi:MAG: ABC transporter permease [Bacteroidales bacterium]